MNKKTTLHPSIKNKFFSLEVTGTLLYYTRAVNSTIITALGSIADRQDNLTEQTMQNFKQLLDYAYSHTDAVLTYQASEMVLAGHIDASYLSETKACIRAGGHLFMSNNTTFLPNNGAVFTISKIIKAVISSASEAELGVLFINCKESIPAR